MTVLNIPAHSRFTARRHGHIISDIVKAKTVEILKINRIYSEHW